MEKPTPLINSSMLRQYTGQIVKIVGKVQRVSMAGSSLTVETSDMGTVEVKLTQNSNVTNDMQYIEVVGKVDEQGECIKEFTCASLGDNLNLGMVEQCIQLQPRFPMLFTDSS